MQEVLQIIFDLGEQKQELLKVYQNSDPHKLAEEFVKQHDLKDDALPMIEETIQQHLKQIPKQTKSQSNIFDRLHHEAQIKQQRKQIQFANQQLSSRNVQQPSTPLNYNPGEVLYQKGKQHMEDIERMQEQKKAEASQIDYPFKPFISERSQLIAKRPHKQSMPDYLLQMGKEMNYHKEQMRNSRYQMETQECSFRPNINLVSERIMQEKSRESLTNIHERLFQEGMQSKKKRQLQSDSEMTNQQSSRRHSKTDIPFMERMQISVVEQRKRKEQTPHQEDYDQSTGQKLYQPQICRPPLARNNDHLPIGEYLYQMRNVKEDKFQCLLEADRQDQLNSRARSLDKSSQIYEIKKRRILQDLFKQMDSDGDGIVSAKRIEISGINSDVLQILAPLLCEMEQINAQLNQQQFIDAANRLIQTLPIVDRDKLMKGLQNKKKMSTDEPTFQPQLNQNSLRMVSTKQNSSVSNHKQHTIEKKKDEMQECTFKPKLYTPLKIYEFMLNQ